MRPRNWVSTTSRVVWLVATGTVLPEQVLGLTFTRKAAQQLGARVRSRLRRLAGSRLLDELDPSGARRAALLAGEPTVATYHAYAGRLVGEHALRLPAEPAARLLSETASWQLAHRVVSTSYRSAEDGIYLVTQKLQDQPSLGLDRFGHRFKIAVHDSDDHFGIIALRHGGEAAQVCKHDRDFPEFAVQGDPAGQDLVADFLRKVLPERLFDEISLSEAFGHFVKGSGEVADFVFCRDLDALG